MQNQNHLYDWKEIARQNQLEPDEGWRIWLILAGRGFGKTRTGAETIKSWVQQKKATHIALIGDTERDVEDVMIHGTSGLLSLYPKEDCPIYRSSRKTLEWPCGAIAQVFSSVSYDQLRGPQFDAAWVDELAKFYNAQETWDQLMFSLRLGTNPRVIVTTTPRPIPLLQTLMKDPTCYITRGSTYDNKDNLPEAFLNHIMESYEGSSLGRQEIHGEINDEFQGALWTQDMFQYGTPPEKSLQEEKSGGIIFVDPPTLKLRGTSLSCLPKPWRR